MNKNSVLKTLFWVVGIIIVAFIVAKAIVQGKQVVADATLSAQRQDQEHKERMAEKFIQYHRQIFGQSQYVFYQDNFRPCA